MVSLDLIDSRAYHSYREQPFAPYRVLYSWVFITFTPVFFSETNILLAVIGLIGVLGTGVVLTYGFVRAPRAL